MSVKKPLKVDGIIKKATALNQYLGAIAVVLLFPFAMLEIVAGAFGFWLLLAMACAYFSKIGAILFIAFGAAMMLDDKKCTRPHHDD